MPYLHDDGTTDYTTISDLMLILTTAFGDPDKTATAQRELRALRQKNTEFSSVIALFQRWATETGYEQATLISFLMDAISSEIKTAMVTIDTPSTLAACITQLQKIDNRQRAIPATTSFRTQGRPKHICSTNPIIHRQSSQPASSSPAFPPSPLSSPKVSFKTPTR